VSLLPATLLICSRNRPQLLRDAIQSILGGHEIPAEIVIVDQSDMPDPELSSFRPQQDCQFRYMWSERKGVSLGRNLAISAALHAILVMTDDDMLAAPTWFGTIVRSLLEHGERSVITGQVLAYEETTGEGYAPSTREDNRSMVYQGRVGRDILLTGNMSIYRSAFEGVGCFDSRLGPGTFFPAAEDSDLGFRLLEAGCRIIYEPRAVTYHRSWRSEKEFLWLQWKYGCGQGGYYAKYFSLKDTYMIRRLLKDIKGYLIRFPFRIFRDRRQAYRDLLYVAGVLYGAARWSLIRRGNADA
jgi:GT2 family glycosyltransferase